MGRKPPLEVLSKRNRTLGKLMRQNIRKYLFSLGGLFLLIFIYRFAFRDDFEVLERIQITSTALFDTLLIAAITVALAMVAQKLQSVGSVVLKWLLTVAGVVGLYAIGVQVMMEGHKWIYILTIGLAAEFEPVFFSLSYQIFDTYLVLATGIVFLIGYEFFERFRVEQKRANQIRQEQIKSELNYLKAQINPHFIFNTLNNIYFTVDEKDVKARQLIEDFSELLRYQLYETGQAQVPLENEAAFIKKYIAIQKVRKEAAFKVEFNESFSSDVFIAPLLLIIPLENAFKYSPSEDGYITIDLTSSEDNVTLRVVNNIDKRIKSKPSASGLGIDNLTKRLHLIYGKNAQFNLTIDDNIAEAEININLSTP